MLYQFRKELLLTLRQQHDVILVMPFVGHEDDFKALGFRCIEAKVDRRGMNPLNDLRLFNTYRKILHQEKPDMVLTYSIKPNIYAGFLCGLMNIPFCANVQGLGTAFEKKGLATFVSFLYRIAFAHVQTVFFENAADATLFYKKGILSPSKVVVLRGAGINLVDYAYCPYPCHHPFRFLFLGRVMKEKGIDELFYAILKLHQDGEDVILDLVGFFEESYKEQVQTLEKQGLVQYHGFQQDPRPFYEACDCLVLPSYHEGMSNVLLEASAIGRPIITSNIPGCKEAVDPEITGLLCEVKNAQSLYLSMKQMLTFSVERREAMGKAARVKMKAEFEKFKVVHDTIRAIVKEK